MLAAYFGCPNKRFRSNYQNHKDRFEEGKHVITLTDTALAEFRSYAQTVGSPFAPHEATRKIHLWTPRGAARHAKMLNTDAAWEVFEKLEDAYFGRGLTQAEPPAPKALPAPPQAGQETLTVSEFEGLLQKKVLLTGAEYLALKRGIRQPAPRPAKTCQPGNLFDSLPHAAVGNNPAPAKPFCLTQREKILISRLVAEGRPKRKIARALGRDISTIYRYLRRRRLNRR
jgi:DNA-binding CsgD family transcriptional regulator